MNTKTLILAAGQGTRMKSKLPKVLHQILGKSLVQYPIEAARKVGTEEICIIVGHQAEKVQETLGEDFKYALQKEQLGTGHAVMQAVDFIGEEGQVFILYGDTPLITAETLEDMLSFHKAEQNAVTVLSALVDDPTGYGRIVRDANGAFLKIVEQKDTTPEEAKIKEINGGMYIFEAGLLKYALSKLTNDNQQGEYYLTDTLEILLKEGHKINATVVKDADEILGVNSRVQLAEALKIMQARINTKHMEQGVTIIDPSNTYIESDVVIGKDTIVEPGCMLQGNTSIGEDCVIGHGTKIRNSTIKDRVAIQSSLITESVVESDVTMGPYVQLRPQSHIAEKVKIGDFVEIKNSSIGVGTKVPHLCYVGDADVGSGVNFGCGTVVVNYDGKNKHRSTIGDNAFIGCNTNLVSPVKVGDYAYTAAGSTITKDVPGDALAIARAQQVNKEGWVKRKNQK